MNKKAQLGFGSPIWNIYTFMVMTILVVMLFAGWIYITGMLNDVFHNVGVINEAQAGQAGYVNMTLAADQTFGVMNQGIQALRMVALTYILAMIAVILITNALVKLHPMWFFPYVLISALAVMFAAPIANAYNTLLSSGVYGGLLPSFTAVNFIILHLPIFVMFIGLFGGILLLINLIRTDNNPNLIQ